MSVNLLFELLNINWLWHLEIVFTLIAKHSNMSQLIKFLSGRFCLYIVCFS